MCHDEAHKAEVKYLLTATRVTDFAAGVEPMSALDLLPIPLTLLPNSGMFLGILLTLRK